MIGLGKWSDIRAALNDLCSLIRVLGSRPTHVWEILIDMPRYVGYHDVAAEGAGGVWFSLGHTMPPVVWYGVWRFHQILHRMWSHSLTRTDQSPTRTWNWQQKSLPWECSLQRLRSSNISQLAHCAITHPPSARLTRWCRNHGRPRQGTSSADWPSCSIATSRTFNNSSRPWEGQHHG